MSTCQRRLSRSPALSRKRSKLGPPHETGPRRILPSSQSATAAASSPMSWASRLLTSTTASAGHDDTEHGDADEGDDAEQRRVSPLAVEQEDGDDREREVEELVPEARQRHRPGDLARCESPAAQHRVRRRDTGGEPAGDDDRERRRDLRDRDRLPEREAGKRDHPRRREGEQVDERGREEQRDPLPREVLHERPDLAVVRDRRQDEGERRDDDAEAERAEPEPLKRASARSAHCDRRVCAMSVTLPRDRTADGGRRAPHRATASVRGRSSAGSLEV